MTFLAKASDIVRSEGDPTVLESGPSSRGSSDNLAKALGWFSIGLGLVELIGARRMAQALGMEGREGLLRAYGAREIASGVTCLSADGMAGVWSRVAGDALDLATLFHAYSDDNPKKTNVGLAIAAVAGVALLDLATAQGLTARHSRRGEPRDYSDRSGWPHGETRSRGAAAGFRARQDRELAAAQ
jgi:hypothetical protein